MEPHRIRGAPKSPDCRCTEILSLPQGDVALVATAPRLWTSSMTELAI